MTVSVPPLRVALVAKRALAALPGLRAAGAVVCAVCETDPQQLARMGEACGLPESRRLSDYADVLCSEADAVVVGTPMHLHAPQAIAALEAGRHVMSAVTAAVSLDQCRALAAACERARAHGLVYMMDENACFRRHTVLIRSLVRRGAFGDVYYAEGEYLHDVKHLHHGPDGAPTWRSTWQVGRNGCTYGTHSLGPILQWLQGTSTGYPDPIASVSCLGSGRHTDPEHAMEDTVVMLCKLASGRLARVRVDMLSNRPQAVSNYTLQGTEGAYESQRASGERHRVWLSTRRERSWQELDDFADDLPEWYRTLASQATEGGHGGGDFFTAWWFAQACLGIREVPITPEAALNWTAAGLVSQDSIRQGGMPLPVPGWAELARAPG